MPFIPAMSLAPAPVLEFGPFQLFPDGRLLRAGRRVRLSPKEWGVLRVLADAGGALVPKEELIARVWGGERVSDASLVRAVYGLRRRLGLTEQGDEFVATSYAKGYWLNAPVGGCQPAGAASAALGRIPENVAPRALEACQEARYHFRKRNVAHIREALRLYALAAEWAPSFVPARIGLVKCHLTLLAWSSVPQAEALAPALAALDAAAGLDGDHPEVLALRASVLGGVQWRFAEAEELFRRAVGSACEAGDVAFFYARHLLLAGHAPRAAELLEQVVDRDPLSPPALAMLGYTRFCAGQPGEALAATRQALALDSRNTEALSYFAVVSMHAGRRQEASAAGYRAYRQASRLAPVRANWAYLCACDGRQEEARRLLREAGEGDFLAPGCMAIAAWALADAPETVAWVRRAARDRCVWLPVACRDPRFAPALGHPGVAATLSGTPLLERFGPAA